MEELARALARLADTAGFLAVCFCGVSVGLPVLVVIIAIISEGAEAIASRIKARR